uniref:DNA cross-link repair 1A protein n=1 Tax=Culex pipiens TaxID=7175 RepID=A0A8D8BJG8_CULPI
MTTSDSGISEQGSVNGETPWYKIVTGTTFAVDALQYEGALPAVTHHFLTHFREGLPLDRIRLLGQTLVMTRETASCVGEVACLQERFFRLVELNKPVTVNGVRVTALENSGSVMFLFQTATGLNILHAGELWPYTEDPSVWGCEVHILYVNTTCVSGRFSFSQQMLAVTDVMALVRANLKHIKHRLLLVCGSNVAQNDQLLKILSNGLNFKIWVQPAGAAALITAGKVQRNRLVTDPCQANIHVLANELPYDLLLTYLDNLPTIFSPVLALRPCTLSRTSFDRARNTIAEPEQPIMSDMRRRFLRILKPLEVISTGDSLLKCEPGVGRLPEGPPPPGALSATMFSRRPCCKFCDSLQLVDRVLTACQRDQF